MNNANNKKLVFKDYIIFAFFGMFAIVGVITSIYLIEGIPRVYHEDSVIKQDSHYADDMTGVAGSDQTASALDDVDPTPSLTQLKRTRSLSGTEVEDNLQLTENNELIVTIDVINLFDHFLFASGEVPGDIIEQGTREYLMSRLPEPALSEALEIFENYMSYIEAQETANAEAMRDLDPNSIHNMDPYEAMGQGEGIKEEMLAHLTDSLNQIKHARREYMGEAVVKGIWAKDEYYDDYTLTRVRILADSDLSEDERKTKLIEHEKTLPEDIREENEGPVSHSKIANSLKEDISPEEAHEINSERYGSEAADRLAALQEKRRQFNAKYEVYSKEKQDIDSSGLSGQDKKFAIDNLRNRHFDSQETKRVAVQDGSSLTSI